MGKVSLVANLDDGMLFLDLMGEGSLLVSIGLAGKEKEAVLRNTQVTSFSAEEYLSTMDYMERYLRDLMSGDFYVYERDVDPEGNNIYAFIRSDRRELSVVSSEEDFDKVREVVYRYLEETLPLEREVNERLLRENPWHPILVTVKDRRYIEETVGICAPLHLTLDLNGQILKLLVASDVCPDDPDLLYLHALSYACCRSIQAGQVCVLRKEEHERLMKNLKTAEKKKELITGYLVDVFATAHALAIAFYLTAELFGGERKKDLVVWLKELVMPEKAELPFMDIAFMCRAFTGYKALELLGEDTDAVLNELPLPLRKGIREMVEAYDRGEDLIKVVMQYALQTA